MFKHNDNDQHNAKTDNHDNDNDTNNSHNNDYNATRLPGRFAAGRLPAARRHGGGPRRVIIISSGR